MPRGIGFGVRNNGGTSLLDLYRTFEFLIAISSFLKKDDHFITFHSVGDKTRIDYLFFRKRARGFFKIHNFILSENLSTQHNLLVLDLEIKQGREKNYISDLGLLGWFNT